MKENSKDLYQEIKKIFNSEPTSNQKAWGLIHDFYHIILTEMEEKNISRSELAVKTGKSKAMISKLLNNSPNISLKKMVELADSVGIDLKITTSQIEKRKENMFFAFKQELRAEAAKSVKAVVSNYFKDINYSCNGKNKCNKIDLNEMELTNVW
ncbi:MAG: helix-turn-helix transcriptional regulator [Candidatus Delongbacteria bacterium]|nr:helix-turn-helix transcriptional regulator [Candidatus Delongbacteria bacterium]